ncbi:MAG: 2-C-methyl-D-erythritol 2,4-cyclodiphosphate synthase [Eubacteriales bacterium]|nr:2-C-methyl-D-erythritol 2,4-cyclodiphosphate synthase [Eubacteriales bacterium]
MEERVYLTALGEDSHRFVSESESKALVLAGLSFPEEVGFLANSDGDIIFHALCHALASLGALDPVLGPPADRLCREEGITDSRVFLELQLSQLKDLDLDYRIHHVSISLEGKRPYLYSHLARLRAAVAEVLKLRAEQVGISATSGEALTAFGRGEGMSCRVLLSGSRLAYPEEK